MPKRIPMRMCVGCREMKPKKELLRIVRTPEGAVCIDRTGKLSGRGAYICRSMECLQKARKTRVLERALDHMVDAAVYERLAEQIAPRAEDITAHE